MDILGIFKTAYYAILLYVIIALKWILTKCVGEPVEVNPEEKKKLCLAKMPVNQIEVDMSYRLDTPDDPTNRIQRYWIYSGVFNGSNVALFAHPEKVREIVQEIGNCKVYELFGYGIKNLYDFIFLARYGHQWCGVPCCGPHTDERKAHMSVDCHARCKAFPRPGSDKGNMYIANIRYMLLKYFGLNENIQDGVVDFICKLYHNKDVDFAFNKFVTPELLDLIERRRIATENPLGENSAHLMKYDGLPDEMKMQKYVWGYQNNGVADFHVLDEFPEGYDPENDDVFVVTHESFSLHNQI